MQTIIIDSIHIPVRYHPSTGPCIDYKDLPTKELDLKYLKPAYRHIGNTIGLIPLTFIEYKNKSFP